MRRLVDRLGDRRRLRACYKADPTGFELARLLHSMGIGCQVVAPSLVPKAPGDEEDRQARLPAAGLAARAGELVAIRIPTVQEEAVRDLWRTRADMVADRTRARHRLSKFLLRHGRGGSAWTHRHQARLLGQRFQEPALRATHSHYRAAVATRAVQLDAIELTLPAGMTSRRSQRR